MTERELERRRGETDAVTGADGFDPAYPGGDFGWCRPVVVVGAFDGAGGEDAGIVRAADDEPDALPLAERQELVESALLEQGEAPGQEEAVEVARLGEFPAGLTSFSPAPMARTAPCSRSSSIAL
jgi:hypothetical protein